ncbi:MAG TPA: hypothetical protein VIH06_01925, partial [Ilumatobacteraceae bacterium]
QVPLDDALLAVLSIGIPIGLGVYLAWVHRSWAKQTKLIGVAAAVLGALAGAFLGFHAAAGVVVIITTIAGAIAGANLALIGLDMTIATRVEPSRQTVVQPERELVSVG